MLNYKEGKFLIEETVEIKTSTGMIQKRELRLAENGELYISANGVSDQNVIDLLFYFDDNQKTMLEWKKFKDQPELTKKDVNYKEVVRYHHQRFDKKGNLLATYY